MVFNGTAQLHGKRIQNERSVKIKVTYCFSCHLITLKTIYRGWIGFKSDVSQRGSLIGRYFIILIKTDEAYKWLLRPVTDEGLATHKNLSNIAYKNGQFDHGFDER